MHALELFCPFIFVNFHEIASDKVLFLVERNRAIENRLAGNSVLLSECIMLRDCHVAIPFAVVLNFSYLPYNNKKDIRIYFMAPYCSNRNTNCYCQASGATNAVNRTLEAASST